MKETNTTFLDTTSPSNVDADIISFSDSSYVVSYAASICIGKTAPQGYIQRVQHVGRVMARGHESTLEHSNLIIMLHIRRDVLEEFTRLTSAMHYLKFYMHKDVEDKDIIYHILIGGSLRAYKNIFRETTEKSNNRVYEAIKNCLYQAAEKEFFQDFIKDGIMNENEFAFAPIGTNRDTTPDQEGNYDVDGVPDLPKTISSTRIDIPEVHQKFYEIYNKVKEYGFTEREICNLCCITVVFHDISRVASMEINRHRNAISQESQRYVNYANKAFIDPMESQNENDKEQLINRLWEIDLFDTKKFVTSKDLGVELCKVYEQLFKQGMIKDDARSFLPSNVYTKLMMTFTYTNLFHFFAMRTAKAAKNELRSIANELLNDFMKYDPEFVKLHDYDKDILEFSETPIYKVMQKQEVGKLNSLDEVIEESEEVSHVSK